MAQAATKGIGPTEAISLGFRYFNEFFADAPKEHVLLEGLEFLEDENLWKVVISFDAGRKKQQQPGPGALFGPTVVEPVKEMRVFYIDAGSGDFVRLEPE